MVTGRQVSVTAPVCPVSNALERVNPYMACCRLAVRPGLAPPGFAVKPEEASAAPHKHYHPHRIA